MTLKSKRFLGFLLIFFALAGIAGYTLAQIRLQQADVRRFAENWASEALQADVKIGKIVYLPPLQLGLKNLKVTRPKGSDQFSVVSIQKLVLGYGIINLIRSDFSFPGTLKIKKPEIHFSSFDSPLPFLDSGGSSKIAPVQIRIEDGKFYYPAGKGKELIFSKIYLKANPEPTGKIRLRFKAGLSGAAQGKLEVDGSTDATFHHYELDIRLNEIGFSPESGIPLRRLNGNLRVSEKEIQVLGATSLFQDWEINVSGKIKDWRAEPKVFLEVAKKGKPPFLFTVKADLVSQRLKGSWTWAGTAYPFRGIVKRDGKSLFFPRLQFPHQYQGRGKVNFSNGDYDFWFGRNERRFHIRSNLNRAEFETEFQLDHALINHLDWVVLGKAHFLPLKTKKGEPGPRFKVEIQTEYVIVQFQPLQDFKGSFELSPEGVEGLKLEWGKAFNLEGRVLFRGSEPRGDLLVRVEGYPLEMIKEFAGRPMPKNLRGTLEGKLKLRGPTAKPEIQGYFTIKDGMIEKLDFDRAVIEFSGFPPQLRLFDSKVLRGRNMLRMTGVIDLRLQNLFHGIQIQRSDNLVIWKGMNVFWKEGESAVEGEKPVNKKLTMAFEVGAGVSSKPEDQGDEKHALVGPKLKF